MDEAECRIVNHDELLALLPWMKRYARRLLRNAWSNYLEADDLVQTACVALLDGNRKYRNPKVAATSSMRDHLRFHGIVRYLKGENPLVRIGNQILSSVPSREDLGGQVWWGHMGLRAVEKEVATLYFVNGLTQAEIAERLGLPPMTVSNRLSRVLKVAKKRLVAQYHGKED